MLRPPIRVLLGPSRHSFEHTLEQGSLLLVPLHSVSLGGWRQIFAAYNQHHATETDKDHGEDAHQHKGCGDVAAVPDIAVAVGPPLRSCLGPHSPQEARQPVNDVETELGVLRGHGRVHSDWVLNEEVRYAHSPVRQYHRPP